MCRDDAIDARLSSIGGQSGPDPATTPEAVIQVYAARAVSWRGVFSMHTWIAVKPSGAPRYARYEVLGFGVAKGSVW
ncbi:MAG TPA: DUF3750 domain-containing protein [Stellaceae bacterium]|nr:DUF3750 domain-containing protein [Stellaceae bacterium]